MKFPDRDGEKRKSIVGRRVRAARMALLPTLTQDDLSGRLAAQKVSLDRVAITKIENGQRCVFDFEIVYLATILKVDVRWLLGMQESGGPTENVG